MSRVFRMLNAPSVADYVRGLTLVRSRVTDAHVRLFQSHYRAPNRAATARQLAAWAGITGGHAVVNSLYGKLAHALCDKLGIKPDLRADFSYRWWSVWSCGYNSPGGFVWEMLPSVAEALERLGWVSAAEFVSPDEISPGEVLVEGAVSRVWINAYERNPEARRRCIEAYGRNCSICGFNFGIVYGQVADGYIHVHHLRPVSEMGAEYVIDPVVDLRPVCPNCHAVLHRFNPPFSIDEVREFMRQGVRAQPVPAADRPPD